MKKNWFRHKRDLFDACEERIIRKSRIFYAILTVLYLAAVIYATLFVVVIKPAQMSRVEIVERDEVTAKIPKSCIVQAEDGSPVVNILREEQGAWGMQYFVMQIPVTEAQEIDEETMFVEDAIGMEGSLIASSTLEFLVDGMEVRLSQSFQETE